MRVERFQIYAEVGLSPDLKKVARCIPSLAKVLIENDSEEIIGDICWAFTYISDGGAT